MISDLREDLVAIDFDDARRRLLERFLRQQLAASSYVVVPSGGDAIVVGRVTLESFHVFVFSASLVDRDRVVEAVRRLEKVVKSQQRKWVSEHPASLRRARDRSAEAVIRSSIRGPLFPHRLPSQSSELRRFATRYPQVLNRIAMAFECPSMWQRSDLRALQQRNADVPPIPNPPRRAVSLARMSPTFRRLTRGEEEGPYDNEASRAAAILNHMEARRYECEEVWSLRHEPGLEWFVQGSYGRPRTDEEAWRFLWRRFQAAKQSRMEHSETVGVRPLELLGAAVVFLTGSQLKVVAACVDALVNGEVRVGQAELAERAGVSSHTVGEVIRRLKLEGWLSAKTAATYTEAEILRAAVPRDLSAKLRHLGYQPPPVERGASRQSPGRRLLLRLREMLRTHAFRPRGIYPGTLQLILAQMLGIKRDVLPWSESAHARALAQVKNLKVLSPTGRVIASKLVRSLRDFARENGLEEDFRRQHEYQEKRRVKVRADIIMRAQSPRKQYREFSKRDPRIAEPLRRHLEAVFGQEWHRGFAL